MQPNAKRKASHRHRDSIDEPTLNLNPMMDMFAVLIPALLMLSAVVELSILNVAAPQISDGGPGPDQPPPTEQQPLNLTLTVTDRGYIIAASGGVLPGAVGADGSAAEGPTIPLIQKQVVCSRYRDFWPPPRERNRTLPMCKQPLEQKTFFVYDQGALVAKLKEIKLAFPTERRIIIVAEPDIEYEAITDVMDVSRGTRAADGSFSPLFDEVVISPGLAE